MDKGKDNQKLGISTTETKRVCHSEIYEILKDYTHEKILILADDTGLLELLRDKDNTEIMELDNNETTINITWSIEDIKCERSCDKKRLYLIASS